MNIHKTLDICAFLAGTLLLFSCSIHEEDAPLRQDRRNNISKQEVVITASLGDEAVSDTRTSLVTDEEGAPEAIYWTPGDQIKIFTAERAPEPVSGAVPTFTEKPLAYTVNAGETEYTFDRRTARFIGITVNGENILAKPVEYNFFRAPVDNDTMKGDWYSQHLNDCIVKVYETGISMDNNCVVIRAKQSFGWSIDKPFARLEVEYRIDGSGALDISCKAQTSNKVDMLPRFGLRLFLPERYENVSYRGYGKLHRQASGVVVRKVHRTR